MNGAIRIIGAVVLAGLVGVGSAPACWYYGWCVPGCRVVPAVPWGYGSGWGMGGAPGMMWWGPGVMGSSPGVVWSSPAVWGVVRGPQVEVIVPGGKGVSGGKAGEAGAKAEKGGGGASGGAGRGAGGEEGRSGKGAAPVGAGAQSGGGAGPVAPAKGSEALPPLTLPAEAGSRERIPPAGLPVPVPPKRDGTSGPGGSSEALPPLTLPPEIPPVVPPVPGAGGSGSSTSRYRGGSEGKEGGEGELRVSYRVWGGGALGEGYRLLRFLNYTEGAVTVEVEGRRVVVPGRSQLPVWVGPVVRWRVAGAAERQWVFTGEVGVVDVVVSRERGVGDGKR